LEKRLQRDLLCGRSKDGVFDKMMKNEMNLLPAGTLVADRYEILEVIGQGGFGITYKAYDSVLDVPVAIKEYYPSGIASRYHEQSLDVQVGGSENRRLFEEGKKKFLEEARILARFSEDPNVVGVRNFFEDNQTVYIVMQYLQGESLKEYIEKNGKISFDEAYRLLRPVMQSLGRIHAAGLIHRDISPSNLIRMRTGKVKLIDFGTAREYSTDGDKSLSIVLKPGYAPAEQYQTHGLQGPWTDVYALCASIYKLITEITPENSLNRMVNDEVRLPSECGAEISAAQEEVLMQGLAVRESDRIRSMEILEEKCEAASRIPDRQNDVTLPIDDERTVMGPSEAFTFENDRPKVPSQMPAHEQQVSFGHTEKPVPERSNAASPLTQKAVDSGRSNITPPQTQEAVDSGRSNAASPQIQEAVDSGRSNAASPQIQEAVDSDRQFGRAQAGKNEKAPAGRKTRAEKKPSDPRGKASSRKGSRIGLKPVLLCILAAVCLFAFVFLRSNGTGGGEASDWLDGKQRVSFRSNDESLTIKKSMLNEINRNSKVASLYFYNCVISDDVIARLASMKRISDVTFSDCTGFSTLSPLSKMTPLRSLTLDGPIVDAPVIDGSALFPTDMPQLTKFDLESYSLKNGFDFLKHFSGLEELQIFSVDLGGESCRLPENPALQTASITYTDLSGVDLSALGNEPNLAFLRLNDDQLTSLSFLRTASALENVSAENNLLTSLDGLQDKDSLSNLYVENNQIKDISALKTCKNLQDFSASNNQIGDISPLEGCSELYNLQLGNNQISDISPLEGCTKLQALNLNKNQIQDAGPLSNCTELISLNLNRNRISDLSCLSGCTKIRDLDFRRNAVSDLGFCENMLNLALLRASENQISSLDGLDNVTQLAEVRLDKNQISDISMLSKNAEHLETAVLDDNQISDLSPLKPCTSLKGLSVNNNQLTTLTGLEDCTKLSFLSASGNKISNITPLRSCTELYTLDLGENEITNIVELSACTSSKMAVLLQNNHIRDISPLYGMKDYVYLSLYNNEITNIDGMPAMTSTGNSSILYLDWWDGLNPETLSQTSYYEPRLVDTPPDQQVNLQNAFQEIRFTAGQYPGEIQFLTKEAADEQIAKDRQDVRLNAGIDLKPEEAE
jgi:Leucine-rich repeat (LRR) protein/tRNA A-37 threonylcarbamoyl transferase component Bud32